MTSTTLPLDDFEAAVQKNLKWNFWVNVIDFALYTFALSFIYSTTVLSMYASHLTQSAVLIGLIPAIQNVGGLLPQLLSAQHSEQLWRQKPFVLKFSVMERLPYLFVALSCLYWASAPSEVSFIILAASLALAVLAGGFIGPAWNQMLAKVIPLERRGLFFGLSSAIGGLLGVAGAAISRQVLGSYAYPTSFGICFLLCFISQVASWCVLSLNREPARKPDSEAVPAREYWRRLPGLLRRDSNFCRYLVARTIMVFGTMATALYIVYGRREFNVVDAFAGSLTMAALITQTGATPLLGLLADRRGNKLLTELSSLLSGGALLVLMLASGSTWLYPVFVLMSAATATIWISGQGIALEFGAQGNLPTYVALANTLIAIPVLVAPLIGGWLADTIGYQGLFIAALVFSIAGWVAMRFGVRDPRHLAHEAASHSAEPAG